MEKLPTIILPEGKKPVESSSPGCSSEEQADGSSARRGSRASSAGSTGSRGSSAGLQSQVSEGMAYVCRSSSFRSGSSHLLTAPVPAAGSPAAAPPAEAVPSLLRLTSVRLRACKPPLLAEDFYIRRIGMQLLHPSLPPEIRWLGRSSSSLLSRRSPAHRSVASSRRNSTCKRPHLHSGSSPRLDASSSNSPGGFSASTPRTQIGSSSRSSSSSSAGSSSTSGVTGGDNSGSSSKAMLGGSGNDTETLSRSISSRSSWLGGPGGGNGDKHRDGSDYTLEWTPGAAPGAAERRQQVGEDGDAAAREAAGGRESSRRMEIGRAAERTCSPAVLAAASATGWKREETDEAAAAAGEEQEEEEREKWEATARETATEYSLSAAIPGEAGGAAGSPFFGEWSQKKAGFDGSDSSEALQKAGSLRIEEERERTWLLEKKKDSPYCVGCHGTGDAGCARPAATSVRVPPPAALAPSASKASPEAMECFYKQGNHELILEIIPPALQPEGAGITPKPYHHVHADVFSRLAFSVSDVNAAQVSLSSHMIRTGAAAQFADVNFAVTCLDLEDFRLRLLQRLSEYNFVRRDGMQQQRHRRTLSRLGSEECPPLGSRPLFHHVELRVRDPAASLAFYQRVLQFRLISKQAIPDFRLTLYFLTTDSTALPPQQAELDSHANRSWLWEQSFSCICLKVYDDAERRAQLRPYAELQPHECGFLGFTLTCKQMNEQELLASLAAAAVPFAKGDDPYYAAEVYHLRDPDGVPLRILICDDACGV